MGISSLHLQFAERFPPLYRGGTLRAQATSVNSEMAHRIEQLNQFVSGLRMGLRFASRENFLETHCLFSFVGHARSLFSVKKIFSPQLKIKLIFFLSVSQRIPNLKPAGEGSRKAHVNKL